MCQQLLSRDQGTDCAQCQVLIQEREKRCSCLSGHAHSVFFWQPRLGQEGNAVLRFLQLIGIVGIFLEHFRFIAARGTNLRPQPPLGALGRADATPFRQLKVARIDAHLDAPARGGVLILDQDALVSELVYHSPRSPLKRLARILFNDAVSHMEDRVIAIKLAMIGNGERGEIVLV
jgi:hypothetical protein